MVVIKKDEEPFDTERTLRERHDAQSLRSAVGWLCSTPRL